MLTTYIKCLETSFTTRQIGYKTQESLPKKLIDRCVPCTTDLFVSQHNAQLPGFFLVSLHIGPFGLLITYMYKPEKVVTDVKTMARGF